MKTQALLKEFKQRDLRALSRLISSVENGAESVFPLLKDLYESRKGGPVIGITGPPGAGKSTLINFFIKEIRSRKKSVAVIAVDPMSPITKGAILGDRIRMTEHFNDPAVFIRSLSSRGKLGGLSIATREVLHLVDAFGFDYLIIETVGVGQSEVDVRKMADLTMVVLTPESGDTIQTLKAGLLEVGDIFALNKADREGADRLSVELKSMLQIVGRENTPVLETSIHREGSIAKLFEAIEQFLNQQKKLIQERRRSCAKEAIYEFLESKLTRELRVWVARQKGASKNPYAFLYKIFKKPSQRLLKLR